MNVGERVQINQGTVSRTVHEVANKIAQKRDDFITLPTTNAQMQRKQEEWSMKYRHPHAIGVIDGSLIPIQRPSQHNHPDEYICRKGYTAINTLVACDASEKFIFVDARWPGSVHDSRIFGLSRIKTVMDSFEGPNSPLLLADSGYGISTSVMVPFRNPREPMELNYNRIFVQERVIIERVIGQWKRRFPILMNPIRVKLDRIPTMIVATAVLHNAGKIYGDNLDEEEPAADEAVSNVTNHASNFVFLQ